jgi:hypothetical protein
MAHATLSIGHAKEFISICIRNREPVLLVGKPGVGKTDIASQAAMEAEADLIVTHPVVSDPTDYKGLPWKNEGSDVADFLPFGDLARMIHAERLTVVLIDDLGQGAPAVQAAIMQLVLARQINGKPISDNVVFIAATNRRADRAGVQGLLEPLKSRFVSIIEVETSVDDWTEWAFQNEIPAELVAFIRTRPELLNKFEPTADLTNSPSPRTWSHVAKLFNMGLPKRLQLPAFSGAVGDGAAAEFIGYLRIYESAPSIDAILSDPKKAPIPDNPAALYAVSVGLAYNASPKTFGSIVTYVKRMYEAGHAPFATLAVRDSTRKDRKITKTKEYIEYVLSDAGKHVREANSEDVKEDTNV